MVLIHYGGSIGYWTQRYFLGRRNPTPSLIHSGGWILFVQLEKHKLNLLCFCVAYNASHIISLEFSMVRGRPQFWGCSTFPVVQTTIKIWNWDEVLQQPSATLGVERPLFSFLLYEYTEWNCRRQILSWHDHKHIFLLKLLCNRILCLSVFSPPSTSTWSTTTASDSVDNRGS